MTDQTSIQAEQTRTRDAALAAPIVSRTGWTDLDVRAVDTARLLAADAVQKVGNGHPGTAMSLAPVAYLLFQNVMRHDPSDSHWLGRDRFVLSCGHSSLTQYVQLYLSGYGLELDDLKALRTWGSQTPGHPEVHHTNGVEITTGPLGSGPGLRGRHGVRAAPRARPVRPGRRPGPEPVRPPHLRARLRRRHHGGRDRRGQLARRAPAARQPHADLRRQPDLDRGRHRHLVLRGRRQALRGLRLARPDRRLARLRADGGATSRTSTRCSTPSSAAKAGDRQAVLHRAADDHRVAGADQAEHRQVARLGARRRRDRGHQAAARLRPRADLRGRRRRAGPRPRGRRPRPAGARRVAEDATTTGAPPTPSAPPCSTGVASRQLPEGLDEALPVFPADAKGVATRAASGKVLTALADRMPELWGGSADLAESNNTTMGGVEQLRPDQPADQRVEGRPLRPHAALRHPRARHGHDPQRDRARGPDPPLRRHVPRLLRLHAPVGPARRASSSCRSPTSGRTTRSASARTARPTSRSSTWPRCAPSRAWTSSARATPTRPPSRGAPSSATPTGRPAWP